MELGEGDVLVHSLGTGLRLHRQGEDRVRSTADLKDEKLSFSHFRKSFTLFIAVAAVTRPSLDFSSKAIVASTLLTFKVMIAKMRFFSLYYHKQSSKLRFPFF